VPYCISKVSYQVKSARDSEGLFEDATVQDQVHPRHRPGRDILLLPVDRQAVRRRVGGLDEERPGTARGIVHGLVQPGVRPDPDHPGHDAGHLGRGVELPLALPPTGWRSAA